MKVFSVLGVTDSGKTTTIENIIKELKRRGYSVGAVKEIPYENYIMHGEGTDAKRHKDAGAEIVIARSLNETNILLKKKLSIQQILSYYHKQDYVVLEGVKDIDVPKILCASKETEIIEQMDDKVIAVSGVISKCLVLFNNIPSMNSITDIDILVDLIEEKVQEYKDKGDAQ